MLYDLVKKYRGRETILMTDNQAKVKRKQAQFRADAPRDNKGNKITYTVRPSEEPTVKFKKKPDPHVR